jgi:hypothetical protein
MLIWVARCAQSGGYAAFGAMSVGAGQGRKALKLLLDHGRDVGSAGALSDLHIDALKLKLRNFR